MNVWTHILRCVLQYGVLVAIGKTLLLAPSLFALFFLDWEDKTVREIQQRDDLTS
jgi:hypothetical protein